MLVSYKFEKRWLTLPTYQINDDWILKRVSKESSSFKEWLNGIITSIQKAAEDNEELKIQLSKEQQELPDLVEVDKQIENTKRKMDVYSKKIERLGSLGSYISDLSSKIQDRISQEFSEASQEASKKYGIDFNVDFLTGKRKSLADSLYDVAKDRGIESEGILYLIKSLPDFESFLYSTSAGKFYRDHTEHQLRVAVLGDFFLEQDLGNGTLLGIVSDLMELEKTDIKDKIWWISGLIHDIGYPLQKMNKSINYAILNQILKCYPMLDLEFSPFEITLTKRDSTQKEYRSKSWRAYLYNLKMPWKMKSKNLSFNYHKTVRYKKLAAAAASFFIFYALCKNQRDIEIL